MYQDIAMTNDSFTRRIILFLFLLLTVGISEMWAENGYPVVSMTYVDSNNPYTSYGTIGWGNNAIAGWNYQGNRDNYPFVEVNGNGYITYLMVDATQSSNSNPIPTGNIIRATLHAKVSGSLDNQRTTTWYVDYNTETDLPATFDGAYGARHFFGTLNSSASSTSTNSSDFDDVTFDITGAINNDADRKVVLVVYETAEGSGYIKEPWVEIIYEGWSVSDFTVSLTDVDKNNKIAAADLPTLNYSDNATVSYVNSGDIMGPLDADKYSYPPRLKQTGDGVVKATIGGNEYTYNLHVTAPTGGGSYNAQTNTYTFDQIGILNQTTFTDVTGITMSVNGGPTVLVVNSNSGPVLKVIDANGYSHPNLNGNIPIEGNYGGTFYKFVTSSSGILTITGELSGMSLYKADGTPIGEGLYSSTSFSLEGGQTYYLYNSNYYNPDKGDLLHSYSFEPVINAGLMFKNPNPTITVDMSEGSYTNEAVSDLGLPVTYTITSGGNYATINATTGEVTFKKSELFSQSFPLTITIQASTEAWDSYGAATATYNLQLTKTTWIFNDNDLWATSGNDLSAPWGERTNYVHHYSDDTYRYQITNRKLTDEVLTKDGSNELPETKGLRFTTDSNNERLMIAPHGESPNYLAGINTSIFVPNVGAGQTVTVDWYATRSYAKIEIKDAGNNTTTPVSQGITSLTVATAGTVTIAITGAVAYIRSIKLSTPVRATGTLTYGRTLLNTGETVNRTGYTIINEETGANIKDDYHGPGSFLSSNPSVVTVDGSGNVTAVSPGFAFITATASPKNSATHQTATLMTLIEVTTLPSGTTRIREVNINKLLYDVGQNGKNADNGLDRIVPGFTLTFGGGDGAKCNSEEKMTLRNNGSEGTMTITPRVNSGANVTIAKVVLTVSSVSNSPMVSVNNGTAIAVTDRRMEISDVNAAPLEIKATQGSFEFTEIKIYYQCESDVDNCLVETKVAPVFGFATQHYMRVPGDGRIFQNDSPTSSNPLNFRANEFSYVSSNTNIATIGSDGSGGLLINSGTATITATFAETDYFDQSTATYTVNNTLLPGESYDNVSMTTGQFIHVTAQASAANTVLTMENAATNLSFGTEQEQHNTYVTSDANVNLKNETNQEITIYAIDILESHIVAWLYYEGQDENFTTQVQFAGFQTGSVKGFKVMDMGDMNNIIDLTNAYEWADNSTFAIQSVENGNPVGDTSYNGTGEFSTGNYGDAEHITQVRRGLQKKAGMADGYPDGLRAISNVTVMQFDADHPVVWNFQNQLDNTGVSGQMGTQWNYNNPGTGREKFYQAAFMNGYMPILKNEEVVKDNNVGILVKGEMRYYCGTSGLRLNLTLTNAHIKFPVKEGMEVKISVASSSADVINTIHNAKSVKVPYEETNTLYIEREGVNSPINAYFLAASDGSMILDAGDKVGVYIKSITLQVPELHFDEEVVTEVTGIGVNTVNYKPYNAVEGHTLNYWVKDNKNYNLNNEQIADGSVATISDEQRHSGDVTLAGGEGWVTIYVEDPQATGVQPKKGEYKLYVVNFSFARSDYWINLDGNGEAYFTERPLGYDKVKTPIDYSMTLGSEDANGRLIQYTNEDPALTTYTMTAYSNGIIYITAKSGSAEAICTVHVGGLSFRYVAPALSENDVAREGYTFTNPWPENWSAYDNYTYEISRSAYGDNVSCDNNPTPTADGLKLTGLGGHGAIRVVVTNNSRWGETARFVLTLSYPASSRKKWAFFRAKDHNNEWGLEIGTIASYVGYNDVGTSATAIGKTIDGYNGSNGSDTWTTSSTWTEIFRKGAELPRWGNDRSMKGDNAFYVQETAGLQIETGNRGFYVDQPARNPSDPSKAYNHIGIHNNASITIPRLREGDYVSLNLSRVIPNNGAILKGHNVTDLRGKDVTEKFTITRSQTDWGSLNDDGSRFIPGYYTFIAHDLRAANDPDKLAHPNEFNVTFELVDEGYLDVLSVEIYDGGVYKHTMTEIKLKDSDELAPNLILKEESDTREILLSFCHPLWSTSTGPCEYVFKGEQIGFTEDYNTPSECRYWVDAATTQKLKDDRKNLNVELDHVKWYSSGGVEYEDGLLKVKQGYGKVVLRMNNYTVEGRYLIGYTPDYTLNVGIIPHQVYPHTWNFTNISGGEVKGKANNVYNSIKSDNSNWIKLAGVDEVYELNTDYRGASLYVPGGELVSTDRILGQRGENPNAYPTRGYDELNCLGVDGKIMFPLSPVAASAREQVSAKTRAVGDHTLLNFSVNSTGILSNTDLSAGNGFINFGAENNFEASSVSSTNYTYRCDGGETKYVLLKPSRTLRAGDIISIKSFSENENGGLAIWTARTNVAGTKRLVTLPVSEKNVEELLEYTVIKDDGVDGLDQVYIYNSGTTTFVDEVTISESYKPDAMGYNLYAVTETTLTIPDLNADGKQDWIYISSDVEPTAITNATPVVEDDDLDGPDANNENHVYKYKAVAQGQAIAPFESKVTFPAGTNIYQIGVTHILKEIHSVGGTGWATESRDHSIDHTLTGYFTENDVDAFKVNYDSYDMETATVALTPVEESKGVPANTGMMLRELDATNLTKANQGKYVPLFYPAVSTALVTDMGFDPNGNMMYPNLTATVHNSEEQTVSSVDYNKFILTNIHWKYSVESTWSKQGDSDNYIEYRNGGWQDHGAPTEADAAGFYRLHIWGNNTDDTMDANSAYLLVPTSQLPTALWMSQPPSSARQNTIGIRDFMGDVTGMEELEVLRSDELNSEDNIWHTLSGIKLDTPPTQPGIYICGRKKVVIK